MLLPRSSRLLACRRILSGASSSSTASFSPPPKGSPASPSTAPSLSSRRCFWSIPIALKSDPLPEHRQASSLPTLTELFDRPSLSSTSSALAPTGLFSQPALTSPDSLPSLAAHVVSRVQLILARLHRAPSAGHAELELVVKNFDRLSDLLCGVIDMCEAIVTLHPDKKWRRKAEETHEGLCRLMNEMNVDVRLYDALKVALDTPEVVKRMTSEEHHTAQVFKHDFQKSGIHLPMTERAQFVSLSDALLMLGRTFSLSLSDPLPPAILPNASALAPGLGQSFVRRVADRKGRATIHPNTWEANMILRKAEDEESRKAVWVAGMVSDEERLHILEGMLDVRRRIAGLVGRNSWGETELENKMAGSPANVTTFLGSLASANRPTTLSEVELLRHLKQQQTASTSLPPLNSWDRDFYLTKHQQGVVASSPALDPVSPYFSVGTIFTGLSRLFESMYGISLVPVETKPGEVWHHSVRKLEVVDHADEGGSVIGTIYCDLFHRDGKAGNAAHYTVRCSRRVDNDDLAGDLPPGQKDWTFDPLAGGLQVVPAAATMREGLYQLPVVVLNCDFETPSRHVPSLLSWPEVDTIFHEMGHAMHSMIGRTGLHNVSGTRVATDLAELPSIFNESFSTAQMLPYLVTHHQTGKPPPQELLLAHQKQRSHFPSLETASQIHMALLDQGLHSISPAQSTIDSTKIYRDVTNQLGIFPAVPGTAPQTQFGHLYGYGASYYSYLFDRAIASRVWDVVFQRGEGGLEGLREGGEKMKGDLLRWGGGRESWSMVGSLLNDEVVKAGGEEAMMRVGEWGVGDVKG